MNNRQAAPCRGAATTDVTRSSVPNAFTSAFTTFPLSVRMPVVSSSVAVLPTVSACAVSADPGREKGPASKGIAAPSIVSERSEAAVRSISFFIVIPPFDRGRLTTKVFVILHYRYSCFYYNAIGIVPQYIRQKLT